METNATIRKLRAELEVAKSYARRAHDEARTDDMTGLGNYRRWREFVEDLQGSGARFTVVLFDIANLKAANALLGHEGADDLLRWIAECIRVETDHAARIGGDEFVVLLPHATREQGELVRDRIETKVGTHNLAPGTAVFIAGDVTTWEPGADLAARMKDADFGLERRKANRKLELGLTVGHDATIAVLAR